MTATPQASVQESRSAAAFQIIPETGACGASIRGLDPRAEHSPEVQQALVRALHEHGVLFVRFDGEIGPEDHRRVARVFGDLREPAFNKGDIPFVSVLDNHKLALYGTHQWHTDHVILPEPPQAASLRGILLPEVGGDTMWASMYAAYEALSSRMQRFLDGLEGFNSVANREHPAQDKTAVHPVVIRDSVTGKPALYVNKGSTQRILGLSDRESDTVLGMLFDHVNTPDFHVRLKWDTQTIAIWEERVTQHRAVADFTGRRIMHRVVVNGAKPEAYGEISREERS